MNPINKPNTSQASQGSLGGKMSEVLSRWLRDEVDDMLPAQVVSYDDVTNRAEIRPLVMIGTTDGAKVARATISNIPVFRFGGGGFFIRFPLKPGDFGWLKANDRDTSLVLQAGGGMDWPNTTRLHSFSDAMFFPDTVKQWVIAGANTDAAVWQSLDGVSTISVHPTKVQIKVGNTTLDVTESGVNIVSSGVVAISSDSGISLVSPPGTLTHNGTNIGDTHKHAGSPSAPPGAVSDTGEPV